MDERIAALVGASAIVVVVLLITATVALVMLRITAPSARTMRRFAAVMAAVGLISIVSAPVLAVAGAGAGRVALIALQGALLLGQAAYMWREARLRD